MQGFAALGTRGSGYAVFLAAELLLDRPVAKLDEQDLPALVPVLRTIRAIETHG